MIEEQNQENASPGKSISRRKWLEKISIPAAAVVGVGMIGTRANASPPEPGDEKKLLGAATYNVRDFGAKGDGKNLDTVAIQKAIDASFKDSGGTVVIPAGIFLCGTIELRSNVTLHLSSHGCLLGSPKREDFTA